MNSATPFLGMITVLAGCLGNGAQACRSSAETTDRTGSSGVHNDAEVARRTSANALDASYNHAQTTDSSSTLDGDAKAATSAPASFPFSKGEWKRLTGIPQECDVLVALNPQASVPTFNWEPCSSGRPGCSRWTADWRSPSTNKVNLLVDTWQTTLIGGQPLFSMQRWAAAGKHNGSMTQSTVLQRIDGTALFAIQSVGRCSAVSWTLGFDERGTALYKTLNYAQPTETGVLLRSTWQSPAEMTSRNLTPEAFTGTPTDLVPVGDTLFTTIERRSGANFGYTTVALNIADGSLHQPRTNGRALDGITPMPVPGGVLLDGNPPDNGLWHFAFNGAFRKVASAQRGFVLTSPIIDLYDRIRIAWVEIDDALNFPPDGPGAIWTAEIVESGDVVNPRKAIDWQNGLIDPGTGFVHNGGYALVVITNLKEGRVVRLSDGYSWVVPGEPDLLFVHAHWIDENYVWFLTGSSGDTRAPGSDGIIRIERSSLGTPLPPDQFQIDAKR